jgi:hypothetical protein
MVVNKENHTKSALLHTIFVNNFTFITLLQNTSRLAAGMGHMFSAVNFLDFKSPSR